jgi:hypothetical protein
MERLKSRTKERVGLGFKSLLFPENYEKVFVGIYLLLLPYIVGSLIVFFYITNANIGTFSAFEGDLSSLLDWCIGYEVLTFLILLLIIKSLFNMNKKTFGSVGGIK